jgi:hypothetical protein
MLGSAQLHRQLGTIGAAISGQGTVGERVGLAAAEMAGQRIYQGGVAKLLAGEKLTQKDLSGLSTEEIDKLTVTKQTLQDMDIKERAAKRDELNAPMERLDKGVKIALALRESGAKPEIVAGLLNKAGQAALADPNLFAGPSALEAAQQLEVTRGGQQRLTNVPGYQAAMDRAKLEADAQIQAANIQYQAMENRLEAEYGIDYGARATVRQVFAAIDPEAKLHPSERAKLAEQKLRDIGKTKEADAIRDMLDKGAFERLAEEGLPTLPGMGIGNTPAINEAAQLIEQVAGGPQVSVPPKPAPVKPPRTAPPDTTDKTYTIKKTAGKHSATIKETAGKHSAMKTEAQRLEEEAAMLKEEAARLAKRRAEMEKRKKESKGKKPANYNTQ